MIVAAMLMKPKDKIKHNTLASTSSPVPKRLFLDFIHLIPSCSMVRTKKRLILKVNFREKSYIKIYGFARLLNNNFTAIELATAKFFAFEDEVIHYHAKRLKDFPCVQVVSV